MSTTASWSAASAEPAHPLAALDGVRSPRGLLRVALGPETRYGARRFRLSADGAVILEALHHSGPLPSYCWIEVVATGALDDDAFVAVLALLRPLVPPGGHIMVEYDSPDRASTARALAAGVPPAATPLGEQLVRAGFAPRFKDWSIPEGGLEGPRKLQCYVPPGEGTGREWRAEAATALRTFLRERADDDRPVVAEARARARRLLREAVSS